MEEFIKEENITKEEEVFSPSGKFKLKINYYSTKPGCWNYSKGLLMNGDKIIGSIERNYCNFFYSFILKDGIEYLVSGKSYTRQTFLNCETGEIFDNSEGDGDDFCWTSVIQYDNNTIVVFGCYWAFPYEFKFFDISDLSKGWYELDRSNIRQTILSNYFYERCEISDGLIKIYWEDFIDIESDSDEMVICIEAHLARENDQIVEKFYIQHKAFSTI